MLSSKIARNLKYLIQRNTRMSASTVTPAAAPNRITGKSEYTPMSTDDWQTSWQDGKSFWHNKTVNPDLQAHIDTLLNGRKNLKILFPLCGKALDMKWLYDDGHTIVGIEYVTQAIEEFFSESNLEYSKEPIEGLGSIYKSCDGRVRIYCCDLFDFKVELEGSVDAIWDRGALVAMNIEDRNKYVASILPLMIGTTRYLVDVCQYDKTQYTGPPHPVEDDEMQNLYGEKCNLHVVNHKDCTEDYKAKGYSVTYMTKTFYMITLK